ncbi:hypothetical protein [Accumulibacter sp.]|jgi:hypothetical protein|uniref:Uncharacterized protein n=1 Tax=Accumulibacter regalis TaxID=522306 RepID=C7RMH1_ACCRE|nr:hypothetical protein [Accumulibacter sp.]MBN8495373.1 hypothetical protein [Accumulibacter sp.]
MELWQAILLAFGGNAALIAILAVLAKSLLDKLIVRDTKVFESELKSKTDAEIERLKNEMARNVESYKVQLKKSEIFFQRELEAASAFSTLFHSILPGYNNPLMDWYEACDEIAHDFGRIETRLSDFMSKHGAVLTDDERALLVDATSDAGYGKFDVIDGDVDSNANQKADELYQKLKNLEAKLIERVRAQASL